MDERRGNVNIPPAHNLVEFIIFHNSVGNGHTHSDQSSNIAEICEFLAESCEVMRGQYQHRIGPCCL